MESAAVTASSNVPSLPLFFWMHLPSLLPRYPLAESKVLGAPSAFYIGYGVVVENGSDAQGNPAPKNATAHNNVTDNTRTEESDEAVRARLRIRLVAAEDVGSRSEQAGSALQRVLPSLQEAALKFIAEPHNSTDSTDSIAAGLSSLSLSATLPVAGGSKGQSAAAAGGSSASKGLPPPLPSTLAELLTDARRAGGDKILDLPDGCPKELSVNASASAIPVACPRGYQLRAGDRVAVLLKRKQIEDRVPPRQNNGAAHGNSSQIAAPEPFKLQMCRHAETGKCKRAESCTYAHTKQELDHWTAECKRKQAHAQRASHVNAGHTGVHEAVTRTSFFIESVLLLELAGLPLSSRVLVGAASQLATVDADIQQKFTLQRSSAALTQQHGPILGRVLSWSELKQSHVCWPFIVQALHNACVGTQQDAASFAAALVELCEERQLLEAGREAASAADTPPEVAASKASEHVAKLRSSRAQLFRMCMLHRPFWICIVERLLLGADKQFDEPILQQLLPLALSCLSPEWVRAFGHRLETLTQRLLGLPRGGERFGVGVTCVLAAVLRHFPSSRAAAGVRIAASVQMVPPSVSVPWLQVPLVPTEGDILNDSWVRTPTPDTLPGLRLDKPYDSPAQFLETQFRLLRADGLAAVTMGVAALAAGRDVDEKDLHMYHSLRLLGFRIKDGGVLAVIQFMPRRKVANAGLAAAGRLMDGNLVCISLDGTWSTSSLLWGMVASGGGRESGGDLLEHSCVLIEMLHEEATTSAGLLGLSRLMTYLPTEFSAVAAEKTGKGGAKPKLKSRSILPPGPAMVESPTYFTAVRFALQNLQRLGNDLARGVCRQIPLEPELVYMGAAQTDTPPRDTAAAGTASRSDAQPAAVQSDPQSFYSPPPAYLAGFDRSLAAPVLIDLDPSQRKAVAGALSHRVWCTQGPPGTGKTYTAAAFVDILLSKTPESKRPRGPILQLAIKNHALDEFLARLLKKYPGQVARVGGRAESAELAAVNLNQLRHDARLDCKVSKKDKQLVSLFHARGAAAARLGELQDKLRTVLELRTRATSPLSLAAFCRFAEADQLVALIRSAVEHHPDAFPRIDGVDLQREYEQALRKALLRARQSNTAAVDPMGSAGAGRRTGGPATTADPSGAEDAQAEGVAVLDSLEERLPIQITDEQLEDAEHTVASRGSRRHKNRQLSLPTPLRALQMAVQSWVEGMADDADVQTMFVKRDEPTHSAAGRVGTESLVASLLRAPATERRGGPDREQNEDGEIADVEAAADAEAVRLLDRDDSDDEPARPAHRPSTGIPIAQRGSNLPPQLLEHLSQQRVTLLQREPSKRAAHGSGGADPLSSLAFLASPWATGLEYLADPANRPQLDQVVKSSQVWELSLKQRAMLLHDVAERAMAAAEKRSAVLMSEYHVASQQAEDASLEFDAAILRNKKVIGMTITGAAKYTRLLEKLGVTVVVVEEAAEVPQPLLYAALPRTVDHIYQAGDHMQLPPQPAHYLLEGATFGLGTSFFQTLVGTPGRARFAFAALSTQNRMHPELAELVRVSGAYQVYDDSVLVKPQADANAQGRKSVDPRPKPPHLAHRLLWWTHAYLEDGHPAPAVSRGGAAAVPGALSRVEADEDEDGAPVAPSWAGAAITTASRSKSNEEEARRAARLAAHHMLHGIHPSRIAIICTYAGQVTRVRALLHDTSHLPAEVIEQACKCGIPAGMDKPAPAADKQLSASAPVAAAAAKAPLLRPSAAEQRYPRVCTVDEFQGDEADHIILSLVRNNNMVPNNRKGGTVGVFGFTAKVNRMIVAISRARCSFVVLGASDFFSRNAKWKEQLDHLRVHDLVRTGFPVVCPRHPSSAANPPTSAESAAALPTSFAAHAASCKEPCHVVMRCGHRCTRRCHADDQSHTVAQAGCTTIVPVKYRQCGHECTMQCQRVTAAGGYPACPMPCDVTLACGHKCQNECGKACHTPEECNLCLEEKDKRATAQLQRRQQEIAAARADIDRQIELMKSETSAAEARTTVSLDDPRAKRVIDQISRFAQPAHGYSITVTKIESVHSRKLVIARLEAAAKLHDPQNEMNMLFHGTRVKNVDSILENGFQVQRRRNVTGGASHASNMFGAAVYVCPDSTKAAREEYTGKDTDGVLLVCDVHMGRIKTVCAADPGMDDISRRNSERYDSAYCSGKTAVRYDEYAVFEPACVLPRFVVYFQRVPLDPPREALRMTGPGSPPYYTPTREEGDIKWYTVTAEQMLASASHSYKTKDWLADEYKNASFWYTNLQSRNGAFAGGNLTQVEVCTNPLLEKRYRAAEETLLKRSISCEPMVVFHGSPSLDSLRSIQRKGFLIGGVDGSVANGTIHGYGVYTGVTADVSKAYSKGCNAILVVDVMPGKSTPNKTGLTMAECSSDDAAVAQFQYQSHKCPDFAVILASPHLCLPRYIIHWK